MSILGTWNLTIATPMGDQSVTLNLVDETSGTASSGGQTGDLYDVAVDGDHATATQDVKSPFPMTVKLDLTASGTP